MENRIAWINRAARNAMLRCRGRTGAEVRGWEPAGLTGKMQGAVQ